MLRREANIPVQIFLNMYRSVNPKYRIILFRILLLAIGCGLTVDCSLRIMWYRLWGIDLGL